MKWTHAGRDYKTYVLASFAALLTFATTARGDVILSGLLQHGTSPGLNGQTAGSPIWNTLGGETSFANIYLTQPNGGYQEPFMNSGNAGSVGLSYALSQGTYEFYFFTYSFWDNNPGEYGLNLFFDGDLVNPGISAYSPANLTSANPAAGNVITLALDGSTTITPILSDLIYQSGNLRVELTLYGFGAPGNFGGPALDRIGNVDSLPDLDLDSVGTFRLTVSEVPEASAAMPMGAVLLCFFIIGGRFRKWLHCRL